VVNLIGELAALGAALTWTFSSVFYRKALTVANPFQANLIRFTTMSPILIAFFLVIGKIAILGSLPISVSAISILSGIIGLVVGDTLYMFALRAVGVSRAVPICYTYPLFNVLIAVTINGEKITPLVVIGGICIVGGTWLISSQMGHSKETGTTSRKGYLVAFCVPIIWAISIALVNLAVTSPGVIGTDGILAVTSVRLLSTWILLLGLAPLFDREFKFVKVSWQTWLTLASAGLMALPLGGYLLSFSFLNTQAARAVPISSTTPFFSVLAGVTLLHETATPRLILGSIVIILGLFLLFAY